MVSLIIGHKGSGKTKLLVDRVNAAVEKSMTIKADALIMRTINNMTAETLVAELNTAGSGLPVVIDTTATGVKAVNLLKLYNETVTTPLTADNAVTDPDFIRFATYQWELLTPAD